MLSSLRLSTLHKPIFSTFLQSINDNVNVNDNDNK